MRRLVKWIAWVFVAVAALSALSVRLERRAAPVRADALPIAAPPPADVPESGPRRPHRPPHPGEAREMTIRRLGNFDYRKLATIPDDVRALDGMGIRLRGYIVPTRQAVRPTEFVLVPTLGACCYGQPPSIEHIVMVSCSEPSPVDAGTATEIVVKGTLHVGQIVQDGNIVALYRVTDASVRPIVR